MKRLVFTTLLLLGIMISNNGYSKLLPIDFGIKGGIVVNNVAMSKLNSGMANSAYVLSSERNTGVNAGLVFRLNLLMFYIQPELLYSSNRYKMMLIDKTTLVKQGADIKAKYSGFDVPILVGARLAFVRMYIGPVFSLSSETTFSKSNIDVRLDRQTISYAAGAGIDFGRLEFDVRYHGYFQRPKQYITNGNNPTVNSNVKVNDVAFSFIYTF